MIGFISRPLAVVPLTFNLPSSFAITHKPAPPCIFRPTRHSAFQSPLASGAGMYRATLRRLSPAIRPSEAGSDRRTTAGVVAVLSILHHHCRPGRAGQRWGAFQGAARNRTGVSDNKQWPTAPMPAHAAAMVSILRRPAIVSHAAAPCISSSIRVEPFLPGV